MHYVVFGRKVNIKKEKLEHDHGQYCHTNKEIILDTQTTGETLLNTKIHEIIHAMAHRLGLRSAGLDETMEEIIAENVPTVLLENFDIKCKAHK